MVAPDGLAVHNQAIIKFFDDAMKNFNRDFGK